MQQPEYVNYERKKEVLCEITCLDVKASSTDPLRLLVFKFNKNDKGEKKKGDDISQLVGQYNHQDEQPLQPVEEEYQPSQAATLPRA